MNSKNMRTVFIFALSIIILFILVLYSAKTGSIDVSFGQMVRGLFIEYDSNVATIYDLRFPRIFIAILAGASLSISGVLLQAVMKNPLTDPGIIGISSAASLMGTIIMFAFPSLFFLAPVFSVVGGLVAYILLYFLSFDAGTNPTRLILVGVALNMTFIGIREVLSSIFGGNLSQVQSIILGAINQKTWTDVRVLFFYTAIFIVISFFTARTCNLLALEDKTAKSLGINVDRSRFFVALIAIVLASATTAVVGVIGFLALIVPHIARLMVGDDHKVLIAYSAVLGGVILLFSDTFGRIIAYPYEISSSILMSTLGGPFFIVLLKMGAKKYEN